MRTEAFETFLNNVIGEDDTILLHYLNNSTVNRCIQNGFNSGMSETETLRALIIILVKLADDDLQRKMLDMMNKPALVTLTRA